MKRGILSFSLLALFLSLITADSSIGTSLDAINVSQDFRLDIDDFEHFEVGFKDSDGNISSAPIDLEVNATGIAEGTVAVYWNIRTSNDFSISLSREKALTSTSNNTVEWDVSEDENTEVSTDYSTAILSVSRPATDSGFKEYKGQKNLNIFTESLNGQTADSDYSASLIIEIKAGGI